VSKAFIALLHEAEDGDGSVDEVVSATAPNIDKDKKGKPGIAKGNKPAPRSKKSLKYVRLKLIDFGTRAALSATNG
jgi:hypothetical protein